MVAHLFQIAMRFLPTGVTRAGPPPERALVMCSARLGSQPTSQRQGLRSKYNSPFQSARPYVYSRCGMVQEIMGKSYGLCGFVASKIGFWRKWWRWWR